MKALLVLPSLFSLSFLPLFSIRPSKFSSSFSSFFSFLQIWFLLSFVMFWNLLAAVHLSVSFLVKYCVLDTLIVIQLLHLLLIPLDTKRLCPSFILLNKTREEEQKVDEQTVYTGQRVNSSSKLFWPFHFQSDVNSHIE